MERHHWSPLLKSGQCLFAKGKHEVLRDGQERTLREPDVASAEGELEEGAEGKSASVTEVTSPPMSYITGARPEQQCRRENKSVAPEIRHVETERTVLIWA
jgi:hypothetical protein